MTPNHMETSHPDTQIDSEMMLETGIKEEPMSPSDAHPPREASTTTRGSSSHTASLKTAMLASSDPVQQDVDVDDNDVGADDERDAESYCGEDDDDDDDHSPHNGHQSNDIAHDGDAPMGSEVTPTSSTSLASATTAPPHLRVRKRVRQILTPEQSQVLNAILVKTHFPSTSVREAAARQLGVSPRKVQVWFQNVRQKEKKRATMAAAAAAAARSPLGGRINLTTAPGSAARTLKGAKATTSGGPTNRQHVVPTSTIYDSHHLHASRGHYPRDAQSSMRHGLQLQTASLDYQSSGVRSASSQPMMRSGNDYSVGNRPYVSAIEGHLPFAVQRPSSSGLLSPGSGREASLMSTTSPGTRTIGIEPVGRHRSASDASAMHRWQSPTDHGCSYDATRSGTRVPVYRLAARPLTHQLPAIGSTTSGALGHRHSRSTLSGPALPQYRGAVPYWLHSASSLRTSADAPHHPRSLQAPSEVPHHHWSSPTEDTDMRQQIVSPQRSQPQLRTIHRARSIQSSLHRARSDYVLLPPLHDLPNPSTVYSPSKSSHSGFSHSPMTSVSSTSSSQVSSYGVVLPEANRHASHHHGHGHYYHQGEYPSASNATESTVSIDMDEEEEGDMSPSTPITPEKGVTSSSASTSALAGEDERGRGRSQWSRDQAQEQVSQRWTTASPVSEGSRWRGAANEGDDSSQQDWTSLQTPKASTYPANIQSLANAPRMALRVNPWKVRAGGPAGSASTAPPSSWQSFGEAASSRQLPTHAHHTRSSRSISQLSSRLESIMSGTEERQSQEEKDVGGANASSAERTTPVSTASTPSGATPKRPPLRRMGCESQIGSFPGLSRSGSQSTDVNRSQSFADYSSSHDDNARGSQSEHSTHESSAFSTVDSQMLTADSEDDHVDLPPIRSLLMQEDKQAAPVASLHTHRATDEAQRQQSPSAIQLPSIKNLQLGV